MDPQETLWNLLDAMSRNDRMAVNEHLESLAEWNASGGFLPQVDRPAVQNVSHFIVRRSIPEAGPTPADLGSSVDVVEPEEPASEFAWNRDPNGERIEPSPGDRLLMPDDWLDVDYTGKLTSEAVVRRRSEFNQDIYIVTPIDDAYYETTLSANIVHWARTAWLAANSPVGLIDVGDDDDS